MEKNKIRTHKRTYISKSEIRGGNSSDVIDRLLKKEKINLPAYFGAPKDEELLEVLEEDSRKIGNLSRFNIKG